MTHPITDLHRRFVSPLKARELAAELRVSEATLREAAERLPEPLSPLAQGELESVPREVASATYRAALCTLHAGSTHAPVGGSGDERAAPALDARR